MDFIKESNTDNSLSEYFKILSNPILSNIKINFKAKIIEPKEVSQNITLDINLEESQNCNAERIWAYLKLQQLSKKELMIHNDMIEMDDEEKDEEASLGLKLGLEHHFVTP